MTIKIDFEFTSKYGKYRDALSLPDDHNLTQSQIEEMKTQRFESWLNMIESSIAIQEELIDVDGETYQKLEGAPPSGAKLIEIDGIWYYKV